MAADCRGCGKPKLTPRRGLCVECRTKPCPRCGVPHRPKIGKGICSGCRRRAKKITDEVYIHS